MGIDDRLVLFALGCVLGFILGRFDLRLRDIKDQMNEIDECVHECRKRIRDERGTMKISAIRHGALLVVVALCFVSTYLSGSAANKSNDTSQRVIQLQSEQKQNVDCTTQVLFDAIRALNERTTYSGAQADANIALVQGQLDLLLRSQDPNLTDAEGQELFQTYVAKVQEFIELANKTKGQQLEFPYPTVEDLTRCLADKPNDNNPDPSEGSTPTPSSQAVPTDSSSPESAPSPTG